MKVYGCLVWNNDATPAPNGGHQVRHVFVGTQAAAARAFGISVYELRTYGGETGNADEISIAMQNPGVGFWQDENAPGKPWRQCKRKER